MPGLSDDQWRSIDEEILAGRMIPAIKNYREYSGEGLREAKDVVEARQRYLSSGKGGEFAPSSAPQEVDWSTMDAEILAGRKITAIKLHRQATGLGLKESKDAVDARESHLREVSPQLFTIPAKTGCMSIILLAFAILLAFHYS